MSYEIGTRIDLSHMNETAAVVEQPASHRLYFPGTRVLFVRMTESLHEINLTPHTIAFMIK